MRSYLPRRDPETGEMFLPVTARGRAVLSDPLLNKGTAFDERERDELGLRGLLPARITTMEDQLRRAYEHFLAAASDMDRNLTLARLQDSNETLFFRLLLEHTEEMTPIIYTPVVAEACRHWSHLFRRTRGLYLTPADKAPHARRCCATRRRRRR